MKLSLKLLVAVALTAIVCGHFVGAHVIPSVVQDQEQVSTTFTN